MKKGDLFGGACHSIWDTSINLDSPEKRLTMEIDVPIIIDPTVRIACLAEWPRATPLPHDSQASILSFTTSGPLFEYKIVLEVSVYKGSFLAVLYVFVFYVATMSSSFRFLTELSSIP